MNRNETENGRQDVPFRPKGVTELLCKENLRVTWFEPDFSQSRYNFEFKNSGSNACTLIALLVASKIHFDKIKIKGPEECLTYDLVEALAHGILEGNSIHENLKSRGALVNINLTVPEAIKYAGKKVQGLLEWKSMLYMEPLETTLYTNLKTQLQEWANTNGKKQFHDLYVVLICDARSVLLVFQNDQETVTLVDSHQHSPNKGALIAVISRNKMRHLCNWFGSVVSKCYQSNPELYELSFLYFEGKYKSKI